MAIENTEGVTAGDTSSKSKPKAGFDGDGKGETSNRYSFEAVRPAGGHGRARHLWEAKRDVDVLCLRLNLEAPYRKQFRQELENFVVHHHLNIRWYDKAIQREVWLRRLYFAGNIFLLLAIPSAIYFLTFKFGKDIDRGINVDSIAALLTGLFGVQRALTAWLDKRQLVALYSKTRAKLKAAVYGFEQTWRHAAAANSDPTAFGAALETATDAARAVVDDEQEQHFEIEAAPTFSVEDLLSGAAASAKNLTGQLSAKETPAQAERRDAEAKAREAEMLIQQYQRLSAQYRDELNKTQDPDRKQTLIAQINDNNAKQRAAELDRAVAMSKVRAAAA